MTSNSLKLYNVLNYLEHAQYISSILSLQSGNCSSKPEMKNHDKKYDAMMMHS